MDTDGGSRWQELHPPLIHILWLTGGKWAKGAADPRWGLLSHQGSTFAPWLKKMIRFGRAVVHLPELWGQKKSKRKIVVLESQGLILLSHVWDDLRGESIVTTLKLSTFSRWLLEFFRSLNLFACATHSCVCMFKEFCSVPFVHQFFSETLLTLKKKDPPLQTSWFRYSQQDGSG